MNQELIRSLTFLNPWWITGKISSELALPFKRDIFEKLFSYLSLERIIVLKGPRRTGKSTLFFQLIKQLLDKGIAKEAILYVSFDILRDKPTLEEIFAAWEMLVKKTLKEMGKVYVFLDEVSYLPSWSLMVKKYFDQKLPLKFLVSSSSASLFEKETESLAGRTVEETLLPFSLRELTEYSYKIKLPKDKFNLKKIKVSSLIAYESQLKVSLEKYLEKGGFPHILTVEEKTLWQKLLKEDVLEKVIYRDLVTLYQVKKPAVLESVFAYSQAITAGILNISQAASVCGLSREYAEKYLFYLERAYLLFRLAKFSRSPKERLRSNRKLHLIDPGIAVLNPQVKTDAVFESAVASHLLRVPSINLFYWRNRFEVDLVLQIGKDIVPCEIKNSSQAAYGVKNLLGFLSYFGQEFGVLVYRGEYQRIKAKGKTIFLYPAWVFLGWI